MSVLLNNIVLMVFENRMVLTLVDKPGNKKFILRSTLSSAFVAKTPEDNRTGQHEAFTEVMTPQLLIVLEYNTSIQSCMNINQSSHLKLLSYKSTFFITKRPNPHKSIHGPGKHFGYLADI